LVMEMTICTGTAPTLTCLLKDFKVALLDIESQKLTVIASEQTRFLPSFTPDGKTILFWGLDNATPSRSGQAIYASVGVYSMALSGAAQRKVFDTKAQNPLAPLTAFQGGNKVAIAASEIRGRVRDQNVIHEFGMSGPQQLADDSLILGNLGDGTLETLWPKGEQTKVLYEVSRNSNTGYVRVRNSQIVRIDMLNPTLRTVILDFQMPGIGNIRHIAVSQTGDLLTYVTGVHLRVGAGSNPVSAAIVVTPLW
jgi:hypothetical protein